MRMFHCPTLDVDLWYSWAIRVVGAILVCLCSGLCLLWIYPYHDLQEGLSTSFEYQGQGRKRLYPYDAIGTGGLLIRPHHALGWVSRFVDELALIAFNCRPDARGQEAQLLLQMKSGKEQLVLSNGKVLFFQEEEKGKGLLPTTSVTNLWIKPILLDNGTVLVEAGRKLTVKEGEYIEEKGQFFLTAQGGAALYSPSQEAFIQELQLARFFPKDLLIQKYGGNEYRSWCERGVLEFRLSTSSYACFVDVGGYLMYDSGEWRPCLFDALRPEVAIAQVKTMTSQGLEIEVWDNRGFYPVIVRVAAEHPDAGKSFQSNVPTKARLRNATQVSCMMGKRRVVLRQGDWWLKTATGWRNLRRVEELEEYLQHRLKGELLIFDVIEKRQGKQMMKGHLFDETRMHVHPFSLPVEGEKLQSKRAQKRRLKKA